MTSASTSAYLLYTLTLRSPAIASTLAGDPNSVATQPFIPGSAIRGAVAARLLAGGTAGDSEEFRELVLSGAVRYLHAYPEVAGARALPAPSSWKSEKDVPDRARDLAGFSGRITEQDDPEDFAESWPEEAHAAAGGPFVAATSSAGARTLCTPRTGARLHQQRDRVKGRPWLDKRGGQELAQGAIFAFEYLEAEQVFRGAVQVTARAQVDRERIKALFDQSILIGRSRRAGYGGQAELAFTADAGREYPSVSGWLSRDVKRGERFRLLLTSAYVGRHPWSGQIDPAALEAELGERLGGHVTAERRRWGFETIGSFNRKWRLEVPQVRAVAAGAVVVFEASRGIPLAKLREIEDEGIGERRVEGFGRVLFLEHTERAEPIHLCRVTERSARRQGVEPPLSDLPDAARAQLEFLEERIVLTAARAELDRSAADLGSQAKKLPTNSLLGRVRTVFRGVHDEGSARGALDKLGTWCSRNQSNALKEKARRQLAACRVGGRELLAWLSTLAQGEEGSGQWQRLVAAAGKASTITGLAQSHHLRASSSAQAVLERRAALLSAHLIDALLAALARRNRGGSR